MALRHAATPDGIAFAVDWKLMTEDAVIPSGDDPMLMENAALSTMRVDQDVVEMPLLLPRWQAEALEAAAKRFVDATRPEDRIAVVTFTAEVQTVAKFTNDREALKHSIDGIEKPVGGTNFWDALMFVLDHVTIQSRVERRRNAVVVMTDGVDNALPGVYGDGSKTTFDQLIENVRRLDTIVVPVYLDTEKEANLSSTPLGAYSLAREQLAMLASESGNIVYRAAKLKDLDKAYAQVIRDLSTVYSIGYRPANRVRDGAWHTVTLRLIDHPDLEVRTRHGYYERN